MQYCARRTWPQCRESLCVFVFVCVLLLLMNESEDGLQRRRSSPELHKTAQLRENHKSVKFIISFPNVIKRKLLINRIRQIQIKCIRVRVCVCFVCASWFLFVGHDHFCVLRSFVFFISLFCLLHQCSCSLLVQQYLRALLFLSYFF